MKKCLFCEVEFDSDNANRKYCSRRCSHAVKTDCGNCGLGIVRKKNSKGIYFCSRMCSSLYKGTTIIKKCQNCNDDIKVKLSASDYGYGKYCSKKCQNEGARIENTEICPECNNVFKTSKNVSDKRKYCSKECMKKSFRRPIKKDVLIELYDNRNLTSREVGDIIGRSKKVVLDYLRFYNIDIKEDGFHNREKIKCKDGHLVKSHYERAFDNYLFKEGIEHEYEVRLPFDKRYACDFKVGDVYIEIWGLIGWDRYDKNRAKKKEMYKNNNCQLLEVFPEDFKKLENKMNELKHLIA